MRRYESNVEKSRLAGRVERKNWGTFDICRVRWGEPMISLSGSIHQKAGHSGHPRRSGGFKREVIGRLSRGRLYHILAAPNKTTWRPCRCP
jgi:hypothetical protein